MNLKTKLILMLGLIFNLALFAQEGYQLSGTVTDGGKMPIPGVNVHIDGTEKGTATDFDGNYSLDVNPGDILHFSYLGYVTQSITMAGQTELNISMVEDASELDEVVVVGYGTQKKSDITGAVSSVKAAELTAYPTSNAEQALQGRAAGVVVQSNNGGEPGAPISIKIRGNTSISASSSPLIVVDGFVGANMPQAADIQSMEVLKDASATAIYGSRGSNGVVLVTTKKGRSGKLVVEINTQYSMQAVEDQLDLLDADQFATYQQMINPDYVQGPANTDWQDLLYQAGDIQNTQASFSGGSDDINFYASTNYFNQEGVVINSKFETLTFLSNVDAQVTDGLKLGMNMFGSRSKKEGVPTQSTGETANGGGDDVVSLMFRFMPDLPVQDADGVNSTSTVGDNIDNPYAIATEAVNETFIDIFRANLYADWNIIENLNFKSTFGFSTENSTLGTFRPSTLVNTAGSIGGKATITNQRQTTVLSENYLTYNTEIGKGNLTLLGGYSYQKTTTANSFTGAQGFISNSFSYHNLGGSEVTLIPTSSYIEQEIQSQFGRVNFDWADKYLLTATVRRDGASNFAQNEKYAIFPSGALGWKMSEEDFLKDSETVSNLKLRASYGVTGNQAISPYESFAKLNPLFTALNNQVVGAVVPDQAANPDLKWETSYQMNLGVDVGFLNNRITASFDYYNIDTKDLLLADESQPEYLGFLTLASIRNVGEINNKGYEISVHSVNITNENFSWTTDLNWSQNKNTVEKLINGIDVFQNAAPGYFSVERTHVLREGEAVGVFWGYDYKGVYQGGDFPEGTATLQGAQEGDPLFADLDGSGVITTDDQEIIGDPNPDWNFGITNTFKYKNFDLNIFFQGAVGGDIFNLTNVQLYNGDSNALTDVLNSWTPENTDTDIPRAVGNRGREISSRFVEDGSYVRLKNLSVGYTFPTELIEKMGLDNLRLSVSGQNLLTFTNYSGLDPEVSYFGSGGESVGDSNTTQGFDFGNYPTIRSLNLALSLRF